MKVNGAVPCLVEVLDVTETCSITVLEKRKILLLGRNNGWPDDKRRKVEHLFQSIAHCSNCKQQIEKALWDLAEAKVQEYLHVFCTKKVVEILQRLGFKRTDLLSTNTEKFEGNVNQKQGHALGHAQRLRQYVVRTGSFIPLRSYQVQFLQPRPLVLCEHAEIQAFRYCAETKVDREEEREIVVFISERCCFMCNEERKYWECVSGLKFVIPGTHGTIWSGGIWNSLSTRTVQDKLAHGIFRILDGAHAFVVIERETGFIKAPPSCSELLKLQCGNVVRPYIE